MTTIDADIFRERRKKLAKQLGNGMIIFLSGEEQIRTPDISYPFRPDSDFYYLTGFAEPDSVLVLICRNGNCKEVLFCRPKSKKLEQWHGYRCGPEVARVRFRFSNTRSIDYLYPALRQFLDSSSWLPIYANEAFAKKLVHEVPEAIQGLSLAKHDFSKVLRIVHEMRVVKDKHELARLRQAAYITSEGFKHVIRTCSMFTTEYALEASLLGEYRRLGAGHMPAFFPIVASGNNACTLHYMENSDPLESGDLILIDSGCEYGFYASDVTRTIPVDGCFTEPQRELYEAVLSAQIEALKMVRPGNTLADSGKASNNQLIETMHRLGILENSANNHRTMAQFQKYAVHDISHYVGLDVHDCGEYQDSDGKLRQFLPGMVLALEPGLYFPESDDFVPARYRGIGIRIEDTILVTDEGHENLTSSIPKTVEEIEELMNGT